MPIPARFLPIAAALTLAACAQPGTVPGSPGTISQGSQGGSRGNLQVEIITELEQINAELKTLRNAVEQTRYASTRQEFRLEDALIDFNRRIQRLEQAQGFETPQGQSFGATLGQGFGTTGEPGFGTTGDPAATAPQFDEPVPEAPLDEPVAALVTPAPTAAPAPAAGVSLADQNRYDQAFALLKQSRYNEAVTQFRELLAASPDSPLAADVYYWIGEVQYINREFALSLEDFQRVVDQYPSSDRVPEALLKIGYVQYDIGDYTAAAATFQDLLARFPGHPTNIAAQTRLQRLQNTIQP